MPDADATFRATPTSRGGVRAAFGRLLTHPVFHAILVVALVASGWVVAGHWDRWTGAARYQRTDDAYVAGDVTPLAAKVSGYIERVAVRDFQPVKAGDVIAEIEPSDYKAQLALARANLDAAEAGLAQIGARRTIQRTLIDQAQATILSAEAEVTRTELEAKRQRNLLQTQLAGTEQRVEQADAEAKRANATRLLNRAQLDQQKALLAELDVQERQLEAQREAARAQFALARNNLNYTTIVAPTDGMVGARQVRPGQFINVGTQVITIVPLPNLWVLANLKETQLTNVRIGDAARVTIDAYPSLVLQGRVDSWSPGTGSTFALLPPDNATGNFTKVVQRVPVKIVLDPDPALGALVRPGMSVIATIDTETRSAPVEGQAQAATR
jgi:membrane fusion protein (multidrug efflux system)